MSDLAFAFAGEEWVARADRSLLRANNRTLYVADLHLGKAETFRAHALPVPHGTTRDTLARLSSAITAASACRVVVLGDLLHARLGRTDRLEAQVSDWRRRHPDTIVQLVRGNHDRVAGSLGRASGIIECDPPCADDGVLLLHHPPRDPPGLPWLAEHVHPAVRLSGPARDHVLLSCFVIGAAGVVLPAFGEFTGRAVIEPVPGDAILVIAGDDVIRVQ